MGTVYQIPLQPQPQQISVQLGANAYQMRFVFRDPFGWFMDIADVSNTPLVSGIPLVTGADLLAQYRYLEFGFALVVQSDGEDPDLPPTFLNLGVSSHLYAVLQ